MVQKADDSTRAALEAIGVTREIGQAQVRAYLHVIDVVVRVVEQETHIVLKFDVTLHNSGNSPASNVSIYASHDGTPPEDYRQTMLVRDIPAQTKRSDQVDRAVLREDVSLNDLGNMSVIFRVLARAKDVFGDDVTAEGKFTGSVAPLHGASASLTPNRIIQVSIGVARERNAAVGITPKMGSRDD